MSQYYAVSTVGLAYDTKGIVKAMPANDLDKIKGKNQRIFLELPSKKPLTEFETETLRGVGFGKYKNMDFEINSPPIHLEKDRLEEGLVLPVKLCYNVLDMDAEMRARDEVLFDTTNTMSFRNGEIEKRISSALDSFATLLVELGLSVKPSEIYVELSATSKIF